MKKHALSLGLVLSAFLSLTACGDGSSESSLTAVAKPNLVVTAPGFQCGQGIVVLEVLNKGTKDAGSSFVRVDQSNSGSTALFIPAIKAGQKFRTSTVVRYRNNSLDAIFKADANKTVDESNELDNRLDLICR